MIHGELYPSNVLVSPDRERLRICPIDWETTSIGPIAIDLAALTTGWPRPARRALVAAYAMAAGPTSDAADGAAAEGTSDRAARAAVAAALAGTGLGEDAEPGATSRLDELLDDVARADVYLAVRWLGWAEGWQPPARAHPRLVGPRRGRARPSGGPVSRYLIVNADDFGRTEGINRGVAAAYEEGIVTGATAMVRFGAAMGAADCARTHPELGVGLHFDLGEWVAVGEQWVAHYRVLDDDSDA